MCWLYKQMVGTTGRGTILGSDEASNDGRRKKSRIFSVRQFETRGKPFVDTLSEPTVCDYYVALTVNL